jgi:Domain of unknown function (DUF4157)
MRPARQPSTVSVSGGQPATRSSAHELPSATHRPPLSAIVQHAAINPGALTREDVLQLQQTIGNVAVGRLLAGAAPRQNRTGLPDRLKTGVEHLSGLAMDDVRVHYNSPKPANVQALAYTQGTEIHLAPGQDKHLPHEAWHVVQQKQGRVPPTLQMRGAAINDDPSLEREADQMGVRSLSTELAVPMPVANGPAGHAPAPVIQRTIAFGAVAYAEKSGRAGSVEVENIEGKPLGAGANAPSVNVFGWPELWAAGHTLGAINTTHYNAVRMHLWNGRLGGPGNQAWNLAPGPAQINSSMSAGPETASKDAVSAGHKIWLKTEVWYQSSSGLANDFTSVIPNRMKMEWGYMTNIGARGPAEPPAWDVPIDQPAGAMTPTQQAVYRGLKDTDTGVLDGMLATASVQTKVQAYTLVTPALQKHMLLKYPDVYRSMSEAERSTALGTLSVSEIDTLKTLLGIGNIRGFYNEIVFYLLDNAGKLQAVYTALSDPQKKELVEYGGWEVLQPLGATAEPLAKAHWSVFKLYPDVAKYNLLDAMSDVEISTLLGGSIDYSLFVNWAKARGCTTAYSIDNYVTPRLTSDMAQNFKDRLKWLYRQEEHQKWLERHPGKFRPRPKTPYTT